MVGMRIDAAIDAFVRQLTADRGLSPQTARAYRGDLLDLAAFAEEAGVVDVDAIDLELLRDWQWRASDRLAKSSMARRTAAVRGFTAWLARTGAAPADAGLRLRAPKAEKHLPRVLSRRQLDGLFAQLEGRASGDDPVALRDLAIIELLYASAIRVSELTGLSLGDVDRTRLTVRVRGKGGKERVVPFGVPAARALDRYLDRGRPGLLRDGSTITGVRYQGPEGPGELRAELTVACDGRTSVIRREAGLKSREFPANFDVWWFRLPREGDAEFSFLPRVAPGKALGGDSPRGVRPDRLPRGKRH